jgi:hypothetical protein
MNTPMHSSRALGKRTKRRRDGVKLDLLERKSILSSMQEIIRSKQAEVQRLRAVNTRP